MMPGIWRGAAGFGLVEVLVALAVLALNVLAWSAVLSLALTLVRRIGELAAGADTALIAYEACELAFVVPFVSADARRGMAFGRSSIVASTPRRSGLTLVELLVALAIGSIVLANVAAMLAASSRAAQHATARADAYIVRSALPMLVTEVVEAAGRGLDDACGLVAAVGGARVTVRRALLDGTVVEEDVFAALDGAGRPALYLRRVPHARQPWVEDVTRFMVGEIEPISSAASEARVSGIVLYIVHEALDDPLAIDVPLPHHPCVEELR